MEETVVKSELVERSCAAWKPGAEIGTVFRSPELRGLHVVKHSIRGVCVAAHAIVFATVDERVVWVGVLAIGATVNLDSDVAIRTAANAFRLRVEADRDAAVRADRVARETRVYDDLSVTSVYNGDPSKTARFATPDLWPVDQQTALVELRESWTRRAPEIELAFARGEGEAVVRRLREQQPKGGASVATNRFVAVTGTPIIDRVFEISTRSSWSVPTRRTCPICRKPCDFPPEPFAVYAGLSDAERVADTDSAKDDLPPSKDPRARADLVPLRLAQVCSACARETVPHAFAQIAGTCQGCPDAVREPRDRNVTPCACGVQMREAARISDAKERRAALGALDGKRRAAWGLRAATARHAAVDRLNRLYVEWHADGPRQPESTPREIVDALTIVGDGHPERPAVTRALRASYAHGLQVMAGFELGLGGVAHENSRWDWVLDRPYWIVPEPTHALLAAVERARILAPERTVPVAVTNTGYDLQALEHPTFCRVCKKEKKCECDVFDAAGHSNVVGRPVCETHGWELEDRCAECEQERQRFVRELSGCARCAAGGPS